MKYFSTLVCENGCGSPTYGYTISRWIFESNKLEIRVVAEGCQCVQSKGYSDRLIKGEVKEPTYDGDWHYPENQIYGDCYVW